MAILPCHSGGDDRAGHPGTALSRHLRGASDHRPPVALPQGRCLTMSCPTSPGSTDEPDGTPPNVKSPSACSLRQRAESEPQRRARLPPPPPDADEETCLAHAETADRGTARRRGDRHHNVCFVVAAAPVADVGSRRTSDSVSPWPRSRCASHRSARSDRDHIARTARHRRLVPDDVDRPWRFPHPLRLASQRGDRPTVSGSPSSCSSPGPAGRSSVTSVTS
jgi:hypothetical protein